MSASIEVTRARALPALRLLATGTILTTSAILATGAAVAPEAEAATRLATPYRCTTQPLLKNGSTGECPKAVQWTLNSFAHRTKQKDAPLALTGLYGPRTTTLVRALQRAYQLPATGVIDARTWPVVVKEAARASVTTATHPTSPSTPRPTATPASTVSRYTLTTTNVRSAASTSSSVVGRLAGGAALTGTMSSGWLKIATPSTYAGRYVSASILSATAPTKPVTTTPTNPTQPGKPTPTKPTPAKPTKPDPSWGKLTTPFACTDRPTLTLGSTGECVKAAAYALNSWNMKNVVGLALLPTNGSFTASMQKDVRVFQNARRLNVSGTVDAPTWRALEVASQQSGGRAVIGQSQSHAAFPGAVKLADGRLMAVYRQASQHALKGTNLGSLWRVYSPDNGYSWSAPERVVLAVPGATSRYVSFTDPSVSVPRTGALAGRPVLTYFTVTYPSRSATVGAPHAWIAVARDTSGRTWGTPQPLDLASGDNDYISSPAVQLDSDHFLAAGYGRVPQPLASDGATLAALSVGMMWGGQQFALSAPSFIAMAGIDSRSRATLWMTEPNVIKLADGRVLALVRQDRSSGQAFIFRSYSYDDGVTWTTATVAFAGSGSPHVAQLRNGLLVVSYRHLTGSSDGRYNASRVGSMQNVYRTSRDGGATWSSEVQIGARPPYEMSYSVPVEYAPNKVAFVWGSESAHGAASNLKVDYVDFNGSR